MASVVHIIRWPDILAHLEAELASTLQRLEAAEGIEMHRLQGEARRIRKMLVLPDTLSFLKEE